MKTSVIAALGERRTVAAVPDLAGLLKAKGAFAGPAAIALGEIGGDAATTALSASLGDAAVKPTAAASLLKCAERYIAAKNSVAAAALYDKLTADAALPVPVRKAAMLGKISTSPTSAGTIVLDLLKGKDGPMQEVAIGKIKDNFKPNAIGQVCSLLPGLPEGSQIKLLAVLSDYPKETVLPTVTKAAQSTSEPVRMAAYQALESVGDASVLKSLI
jgi:HEAT repeat protein